MGYQAGYYKCYSRARSRLSISRIGACMHSNLGEVVIRSGKKTKYRNKDNPAVELIRQVIAHKEQNRPESYDYVQYKEYDKMMFSLLNVSPTISDKKFFRKYKFLLDNRDSTTVPGKIVAAYIS